MVLVKICGLTNPEDVLLSIDAGADFLGFVNAKSPRYLTPEEIARLISETDPSVPTVLVVDSTDTNIILNTFEAAGTDLLQIHAPLPLSDYSILKDSAPGLIATVHVPKELTDTFMKRVYEISKIADYILLDTMSATASGGTGEVFNWGVVPRIRSKAPIILAGGLSPENVSEAIRIARPFAVDVSSGVEMVKRKKDPSKLRRFIHLAKTSL